MQYVHQLTKTAYVGENVSLDVLPGIVSDFTMAVVASTAGQETARDGDLQTLDVIRQELRGKGWKSFCEQPKNHSPELHVLEGAGISTTSGSG